MESVKDATGSQVVDLVNYMMPQLLDAIKGEPDVDVLSTMVETLTTIVGMVGPPVISAELMPAAAQTLSMLLLESEARHLEREQMPEQEYCDEEGQEDAEVEEAKVEQLVSRVASANGALLRICLLYTSPSPRDQRGSRMPSSA